MNDLFHSLAAKYEYENEQPRAEAGQRARDEIANMAEPEQVELFEKDSGVIDYFQGMRNLFKKIDGGER